MKTADQINNIRIKTNNLKTLLLKKTGIHNSTDHEIQNVNTYDGKPTRKKIIKIPVSHRKTPLTVHLYLPSECSKGEKKHIILGSHGLSSNPGSFLDSSLLLANSDFIVALPVHMGSDRQFLEDSLNGYHRQLFEPEAFYKRPLDLKSTLDYLENSQKEKKICAGNFETNNVGALGHSLGGYAVLALAGAEYQENRIKHLCDDILNQTNLSMAVQCRSLEVQNLEKRMIKDSRIRAIYLLNPVNSIVFGPRGLSEVKVPVFFLGGTLDSATPPVIEMVRPFLDLKATRHKFFAIQEGGAHVNWDNLPREIMESVENFFGIDLPNQSIINRNFALTTDAFFRVYVKNQPKHKRRLTTHAGNNLSTRGARFFLIEPGNDRFFKKHLNKIAM